MKKHHRGRLAQKSAGNLAAKVVALRGDSLRMIVMMLIISIIITIISIMVLMIVAVAIMNTIYCLTLSIAMF